jgi:hypothetical protein
VNYRGKALVFSWVLIGPLSPGEVKILLKEADERTYRGGSVDEETNWDAPSTLQVQRPGSCSTYDVDGLVVMAEPVADVGAFDGVSLRPFTLLDKQPRKGFSSLRGCLLLRE